MEDANISCDGKAPPKHHGRTKQICLVVLHYLNNISFQLVKVDAFFRLSSPVKELRLFRVVRKTTLYHKIPLPNHRHNQPPFPLRNPL